jgi:hypothetical protein
MDKILQFLPKTILSSYVQICENSLNSLHFMAKLCRGKTKISFPQQPRRCIFNYIQISPKRAANPSAGNPLLNLLNLTWPCTKDSQNLLFRNLLRNPLNLTWLCTKASQTFTGTFTGILLNLTWICTKASRNLLRKLLRNLVELDLALHQNFPDLYRNLFRNPVESDLTLHHIELGSAPKPSDPSREFRNTIEFDRSAPKPPRPSPKPSELFPEFR